MKKKVIVWMMMAGLAALAGGCVHTADDRSQFGVPWLKDDAQGQYPRSVSQILDAARAVINASGELTADNSVNHSLRGKVKGDNIYVRVDEVDVTQPVSKVVVQARTPGGLADADLAQGLLTKMVLKLSAPESAESP
jgi:ClpP class serine protease